MNSHFLTSALLGALLITCPTQVRGSIAYGSINNFDTVNDTGSECHGFEIEIEDCHSTDITYTYNYNHYGVPGITQDDSVAGHPKCRIRWESKKNPNGSWAAFTAIPAGPINPTNGHQFTNPSVNFGGEHFGVGYRAAVGAVKYNWLIDNGTGTLINGGAVQVSTPTFTYYPPVGGAPAQVQAVIAPPPPPAPPPKQFGKAVWMKEIKTTTHNNRKIKLRELVSDDPDDPTDKNWANGEPDEVEVEWRILQKNSGEPDGGVNNEVPAAPEDLPNGDEVVTRRYEFYKYTGPLDAETGEGMADAVGPDNIHGSGSATYADHFNPAIGEWVSVTTDMSTLEVVGEYAGAQMAAVDVEGAVGLIDHLGEGKINAPYAARTVVVEGALPFLAIGEGDLPPGMTFDEFSGVLSGTPTASGSFQFKVTATDLTNPDVMKTYTLKIAPAGAALPPSCLLDTVISPVGAGTTTGDGSYAIGANATITATSNPGFAFKNWTDDNVIVSANLSHTLALDVNHTLVANFSPIYTIATGASPAAGGTTTGNGTYTEGEVVLLTATANAGYAFLNWTEDGAVVSSASSLTFTANSDRLLVANFTQGTSYTVTTTRAPTNGGTTTGAGTYVGGASVTVTATSNAGYSFAGWTEGGAVASAAAAYTFTINANRSLTANFTPTSGNFTPPVAASEYTVTDITGWTPAQLATLPYFDRFVPTQPAGATADFQATSQNGFGVVAGNRNFQTGFVQGSGAFVLNGATTLVPAWGQYAWSESIWDGTDFHFSNGFVEHSPVTDVAFTGKLIGYANLPGAGNGPSAATDYSDHVFIFDPATSTKVDLTPTARRAEARSINDRDEIVGNWSDHDADHAFLHTPDGGMAEFSGIATTSIRPKVISNRGMVAGTYSTVMADALPFVCTGGMIISPLNLPSQGNVDACAVTDANDHGIIVGHAWKSTTPNEPYALRWFLKNGAWEAEDINEALSNNGFIVDAALAVNDAGYIVATGHADGTGVFHNKTLLLTPDKFPPPAAVSLKPAEITATSARLMAKINACTRTTTVSFHSGPTNAYGLVNPAAEGTVAGTSPAARSFTLTGLLPGTTYHCRVSGVSSKGTTLGDDVEFTTLDTYLVWKTRNYGADAGNPAVSGDAMDSDQDGLNTFAEYAFGTNPTQPDSAAVASPPDEEGLCISYRRPTGVTGVIYTVEVASNPAGPWLSGASYTRSVITHCSGGMEEVKTCSLLPRASTPRQFMRVKLEAPSP